MARLARYFARRGANLTVRPVYYQPARLIPLLARGYLMAGLAAGLGLTTIDAPLALAAPLQQAEWQVSIGRLPLNEALTLLARQMDMATARFSDVGSENMLVGPLSGRYSRDVALRLLLHGTGLTYRFVNDHTVAIMRETGPAAEVPSKPQARAIPPSPDEMGSNAAGNVNNEGNQSVSVKPEKPKHRSLWSRFLCLIAVCGATSLQPHHVQAQQPAAGSPSGVQQSTGASEVQLQAVTVTGTRIAGAGYETPTPVTVLSQKSLELSSPGSIFSALVQAPQLINSPQSNTASQDVTPDGNYLSVRNLGADRTLILLDGIRVPPTTYNGLVNVDILPQLLVKRVEVVTAGASAAYGSDAVGGVVNYVLDNDFTGMKALTQGGITSRGDNENYRLGFAVGHQFGNTHVLLSVDRYQTKGYLVGDLPNETEGYFGVGQNAVGVPGTAENPLVILPDVHLGVTTIGGFATSGPFAGTNFVTPMSYHPINQGIPTTSPGYFLGGEYQDYSKLRAYEGPPSQTTVGFARLTHEIADNMQLLAQLNVADNSESYILFPNFVPSQTIFSGNAFLPTALQQELTDTGTPSFTMSKTLNEIAGQLALQTTRNYGGLVGLKGTFASARWNLTYQHTQTKYNYSQSGVLELPKFAAAVDAVRDPNGNIVCRPSLSSDPAVAARYADCVPFDLFGYGAATQTAINYATGVSLQSTNLKTDDAQGTISGDVLNLPAGPLAVALGAEYRRQSLDLDSNSNPAIPQDTTGLRGISPDTTRFFDSNSNVGSGVVKVAEGFAEVEAPLLANARFAHELSLNGAIRLAHYSTSGRALTWKYGGVWAPMSALRFRLTRSRDIRAPNAYELFGTSTVSMGAFFDPHTGTSQATTITQAGGNPDLTPEIGDTLTAGVVVTPTFLTGLAFSVDYYDVKLTNAITTNSIADELASCEASNGTSPICDLISRPFSFSDHSPGNFPTLVQVVPVNVASLLTRGVDLEATYRRALGPGELLVHAAGEYVTTFLQQAGPTQPQVSELGALMPKLVLTPSFTYMLNGLTLYLQERIFGENLTTPIAGVYYVNSHIQTVTYTDMTVSYQPRISDSHIQYFLTVQNLFDKAAPISPQGPLPESLPAKTFYDTAGRQFTLGMRLLF